MNPDTVSNITFRMPKNILSGFTINHKALIIKYCNNSVKVMQRSMKWSREPKVKSITTFDKDVKA